MSDQSVHVPVKNGIIVVQARTGGELAVFEDGVLRHWWTADEAVRVAAGLATVAVASMTAAAENNSLGKGLRV